MDLAVNTHFEQGWPLAALGQVAEAHAGGIRDALGWGKIEQMRGQYSFTPANSGYLDQACRRNIPVLLTLSPKQPGYDGGETVYSDEGRKAFGRFALAVADRFPCVTAFEIGNEINDHSLKGRMTAGMPQSYIEILDAVRAAVKPGHPRIALLSGSSLSVATGFFGKLIDAGLLSRVDGIVVHPYLAVPEQFPRQIERLRAIMARAGGARPIWASEFGYMYPTLTAAPSHALKMMVLMSAAGVKRADWYALREEKWYPNMGLFGMDGRGFPALDTFRLASERLLPGSDARRVDAGDPVSFVYRFGNGLYVAWGQGRGIEVTGGGRAWDARGQAIAMPSTLTDDPVVIEAPGGVRLTAATVRDDSLTNFAGASWSYAVANSAGGEQRMDWIDWNWAPYLGLCAFPNFRVMGAGLSVGRPSDKPPRLVERYTAPMAGPVEVSACFEGKPAFPLSVTVAAPGRTLWSGTVDATMRLPAWSVALRAGDAITISYRAIKPGGPQLLRRRIRILTGSTDSPALCAPSGKDVGGEAGRP